MPTRILLGCDFSSAPTKRKNIVVAVGARQAEDAVRLSALHRFSSLDDWSAWLAAQSAWVGGFDLPFGLPRELVETLHWPGQWAALMAHYGQLERSEIRRQFSGFCASRPAGGKFAHRATDGPAGSSPSMKWVNPPVAWMLHAGVPRLLAIGAHFPAHQPIPERTPPRIALEAYPGLLARQLIGRTSYKSDEAGRQTIERRQAREQMLTALLEGRTELGLKLDIDTAQANALVEDGSGDALDAVLCLVQAAWALRHQDTPGPGYGLPPDIDPVEGWILCAKRP
ncbi:DUF429 domain-containing protein [Variovorax dokdonensis]